MKTKFICLLVVLFTILCPLMMFEIQDYIDQSRSYAMPDTSIDDLLIKKHPIISSVYQEFYSSVQHDYFTYNYTDISIYNKDEQDKLKQIKKDLEKEINSVLSYHVIKPAYLNQKEDTYSIHFGSLYSHLDKQEKAYYLEQIFSLNETGSNSVTWNFLNDVKKIYGITITQETMKIPSQKDQKDIAWAFISYLGLDDLDDWNYTAYGYESYASKLQVYCDVIQFDNHQITIDIGICPLGQHNRNHAYISN
ncbi:MAG: hypothetical protein ACLSUR_17570 [Coprobacillus cateniformis]